MHFSSQPTHARKLRPAPRVRTREMIDAVGHSSGKNRLYTSCSANLLETQAPTESKLRGKMSLRDKLDVVSESAATGIPL